MSAAHQDELPLSSVRAHTLFPGRSMLYLREVAKALSVHVDQVTKLIEQGQLVAVDIASPKKSPVNPGGSSSGRQYWRIPVSAYDAFIANRASTSANSPTQGGAQ